MPEQTLSRRRFLGRTALGIGLSNICTHLGCRVRWATDEQQYLCPCHIGIFAKDGTVVSGPPPRPLDSYDLRVEDGQIQVKLDL